MYTLFIIGIDETNFKRLKDMEESKEYSYVVAIGYEEGLGGRYQSYKKLLDLANKRIEESGKKPSGFLCYSDYPFSLLTADLAKRYGLPGKPVPAVLACEHKYLSRVMQKRAVPDMVPAFQAFDPFADNPKDQVELDYPFWMKPVIGAGSKLAFRIECDEDLEQAVAETREQIHLWGDSFNEALDEDGLPDEAEGVGGYHCLLEADIQTANQCTLCAFIFEGEYHPYGVVDSINYRHVPSFFRYEYPSTLPEDVQERIRDAGGKMMKEIGFDTGAFNIEFFHDPETDDLHVIELNSRISKSHFELYHRVDGKRNLLMPMRLAIGRKPDFPYREGEAAHATKIFFRRFNDGIVRRAPTQEEIDRVEEIVPNAEVVWGQPEGQRLGEYAYRDVYSYWLGEVYLSFDDHEELLQQFSRVLLSLPHLVENVDEEST